VRWWCGLLAVAWSMVWGASAGAAALDKEAAAAALEFAKTHHPELATLLEQLRTSAPKDFEAALTELNRTRERLERSRERTPERYELELAEWKLNSQIRLLAARLAMGGDAALEDELRSLLAERLQIRVKLLQDERTRLHKRLEQLDQQIADQNDRSAAILEREFSRLRSPNPLPAKSAKQPGKSNSVPPVKPNGAKSPNRAESKVTAKPNVSAAGSPVKSEPADAAGSPRKPEASPQPKDPTPAPSGKAPKAGGKASTADHKEATSPRSKKK